LAATKTRKGGKYKAELDPFKLYDDYMANANRHIEITPVLAYARELMGSIKNPKTGKIFNMAKQNPNTAVFLDKWINYVAGQPMWELPPLADWAVRTLNRNSVFAIIGGNVRTAGIQVSALRNTIPEVGFGNAGLGVIDLFNPAKHHQAWRKSNVLVTRKFDAIVEDAMRTIKSGKIGSLQRAVGQASLWPLKLLDLRTAEASWNAAYRQAKKAGLAEKKAINYADDVVVRTQGSAMRGDLSPIQRSAIGRMVSMFQTFVINDWGFLTKDVLGRGAKYRPKELDVSHKTVKKVLRYITATTLFNMFYEDILQMNSPFPTPIRAYMRAQEEGKTIPETIMAIAAELAEPIPLLGGSLRYGVEPGGPALGLANDIFQALHGKPGSKPYEELVGRLFGVPATAQIMKMKRAEKRGESLYGQIVGSYTRKKSSGIPTLPSLPGLPKLP